MRSFRRYAIYYAPPPASPLARFGADWLGWDADAGCLRDGFDLPGLPRPRAEITATPRRYGFHATLKAPFRLAPGCGRAGLEAAVAALAGGVAAFPLALRLDALGPFLALAPGADSPPLAALADACVTRLDGFRAPPSEAELARRRAPGLAPAEEAHLVRWGYPYVLGTFRFHMTLTGRLPPDDRRATRAALETVTAPLIALPAPVTEICVCGEAADGFFHVLRRFALLGSTEGLR